MSEMGKKGDFVPHRVA